MRSIRSLRHRAQTGIRRHSGEHRRRVVRAWRELADLPSELGRELTRPAATLRPVRVEIPIRRR